MVSASGQIFKTIHRHWTNLKQSVSKRANGLWHCLFYYHRHICRSLFHNIPWVSMRMESLIFFFLEYFLHSKTRLTPFLPCGCSFSVSQREREFELNISITDAAVVANSSLSGYENCYFRNAWKKLVLLRKVKKITLPAAVLSGLDIRCETKRGQGVKTQFSQL